MMLKRAFSSVDEGELPIHEIEVGSTTKVAGMLPLVEEFTTRLKPDPKYMYTLVNAMGYSEYFGPNSNTDYYGYNPHLGFNGLLHTPDTCSNHGEYCGWQTDPVVQARLAKSWPFGYPSYYGATVYAHHKNSDPNSLGFGDVIFAAPNEAMKRIELVMRVNVALAAERGHTAILDRVHRGDRVDVSMGCFKAGAMVTLADGTKKPIETIAVGDRVRTHTGGTGMVTELHRRRYEGEFFEIKPANEDAFVATVGHPFFAAYGAKDAHRVWAKEKPSFDWAYAKDLDGAVLSRPKVTKMVKAAGVTTAWARLLGYYLAEGHIVFDKQGDYAGIELTVNHSDAVNAEIADLCVAVGARNAPVWRQRENSESSWAIGIYDPLVAHACARVCGQYSKTKRLEEEVLYWPEDLQYELLGAYFNGDGFTSEGDLLCSTSSDALVHQVREILFRLGIPTSYQYLHHKAGSGKSREDTFEWVISIGKQWAGKFAPYCAKAIVTEVRKTKNILKDYGDLWAVPIREYTSFYDEADVYNFEVEGDNSYIVNGVAAHNCKVPFDLCLHPETVLRTPDGWRAASELDVGDEVLTHRGRMRRIVRRFDREAEELLDVRVVGLPSLRVTATHPLYVVREEALRQCVGSVNGRRRRCSPTSEGVCTFCGTSIELNPEWVDAKDVRVGDYVAAPTGELGDVQVSAAKARLLGYWLGDGHRIRQRTGKAKNGPYRLMGFGITTSDAETEHYVRMFDTIVAAGASNAPNTYEAGEGRRAFQTHVYDQVLAQWLLEHGANATYVKRVDESVFSWSREALLELLGGWVDTDGHASPNGLLRITTVVLGLALDAQRLLRLLGVPSGVTVGTLEDGSSAYWVSIQADHAQRLEFWKYSVKAVPVERGRAGGTKILIANGLALHPVRVLKRDSYAGPVVNFSVEEDESYVAGGLATHNCSICTDWETVKKVQKSYDPKRHSSPGIPILAYHRTVKPIRGLAITKADYCSHMVEQRGAILDDGRKVFVYNDFPRFFDISFVWVGADRTARVMWFMGQHGSKPGKKQKPTSIDDYVKHAAKEPMMSKVAHQTLNTKKVSELKQSEMEKEIPGGLARKIEVCANGEMDMPFGAMAGFSQQHGIKTLLSTLAGLGIILKPQEFHEAVGTAHPLQKKIAEMAREHNMTFKTSLPGYDDQYAVSPNSFNLKLAEELIQYVEGRSSFAPHLHYRMGTMEKQASASVSQLVDAIFVHDVAAQYNGYRASLVKEAAGLMPRYFDLFPPSARDMSKTSSLGGLLLSSSTVVHWVSAHLEKVADAEVELGTAVNYVMNNSPDCRKLSALGSQVCVTLDSRTDFMSAVKTAVRTAL